MATDEGQAGVEGAVLSHLETQTQTSAPNLGSFTGGRTLHPPTPHTLPRLLIPGGSFSPRRCCAAQRARLAQAVHGKRFWLLLRPLSPTRASGGCSGWPVPGAPPVARRLPSHFMVSIWKTWRVLFPKIFGAKNFSEFFFFFTNCKPRLQF